jgi:hypothetical protein
MLQTMDLDFVARAPRGAEVEELTGKQLLKCLRNKMAINQYLEMTGLESTGASRQPMDDRMEGGGGPPPNRGDRRDDRGPRRDGGDRGPPRMPPGPPPNQAPPPSAAPPPPPPPPVELPPRLAGFFNLLGGIENTSKSLFLNPEDAVVGESPVKEMIDRLAQLEPPAKTVIFDGVVSQRLLDVAKERGVDTVIANRMGAVGKIPDGLTVLTRMDLDAR